MNLDHETQFLTFKMCFHLPIFPNVSPDKYRYKEELNSIVQLI